VPWEGLHLYDVIFPLFIFITGVSIVLSLPGLAEREGKAKAHLRVLHRSLLLYGLGLIAAGGISAHRSDVRLSGVLQRIAICYLITSLIFLNGSLRAITAALIGLLAGYWALMTLVPVPESELDRLLPMQTWRTGSTVGTCLAGYGSRLCENSVGVMIPLLNRRGLGDGVRAGGRSASDDADA
jgi:predicted acyltransferase